VSNRGLIADPCRPTKHTLWTLCMRAQIIRNNHMTLHRLHLSGYSKPVYFRLVFDSLPLRLISPLWGTWTYSGGPCLTLQPLEKCSNCYHGLWLSHNSKAQDPAYPYLPFFIYRLVWSISLCGSGGDTMPDSSHQRREKKKKKSQNLWRKKSLRIYYISCQRLITVC